MTAWIRPIRNFSIIAHIDHGKSTLADRILQATGAVSERDMRSQVLDSMDLERDEGSDQGPGGADPYTAAAGPATSSTDRHPGHVDFSYEVSRSLAACERALLVVDASQGIEAQTLANAYLAIEGDLELIPVLNKIDLPAADPDLHGRALADLVGEAPGRVLRISAKPRGSPGEIVRAGAAARRRPGGAGAGLIFDSVYDQYRGVVAFVRAVDGRFRQGDRPARDADGARGRRRGDRRDVAGHGAGRDAQGGGDRLPGDGAKSIGDLRVGTR